MGHKYWCWTQGALHRSYKKASHRAAFCLVCSNGNMSTCPTPVHHQDQKNKPCAGKGVRQYTISTFSIFSNGFLKYSQKWDFLLKIKVPYYSPLQLICNSSIFVWEQNLYMFHYASFNIQIFFKWFHKILTSLRFSVKREKKTSLFCAIYN